MKNDATHIFSKEIRNRAQEILKIWPNIEGWPGQRDCVSLSLSVALFQSDFNVAGSIAEIGVHHGKYFLLLDSFRRKHEKIIAIDLFENQEGNIDKSGKGNRKIFDQNVALYSHDPTGVHVIAGDSLKINKSEFDKFEGIRIFSVDGGHTAEHSYNDIALAESLICDNGVIIVDDYFDPQWCGVHVGVCRYLESKRSNLVPFAASRKKLFLTNADSYPLLFTHLRADPNLCFKGLRVRQADYGDLPILTVVPAQPK